MSSLDDFYNEVGDVKKGHQFGNFECLNDTHRLARDHLTEFAAQIVQHACVIDTIAAPHLVVLHGDTGRGKTHLAEAFINHILHGAPRLREVVHLSRRHFSGDMLDSCDRYRNKRIVVIEDIFADDDMRRNPSRLSEVSDYEVGSFAKFMRELYEKPELVVITSAFPILKVPGSTGMLARMRKLDSTGEFVSRAQVVLKQAREFELQGPDYRHRQSKALPSGTFRLALPGSSSDDTGKPSSKPEGKRTKKKGPLPPKGK